MRTTLLLLLITNTAMAAPHVLLLPAVGTPQQVTVHGRVLVEAPAPSESALSKNLNRLTVRNLEGASVEVSFAGRTVTTRSGHDGEFEATFQALDGPPFEVGVRFVDASVGESKARASVTVAPLSSPFLLVSDFDDTVAVTNVRSKRGLVKSSLLQDARSQPVVPGMSAFFRCLRSHPSPVPLAFVSGSPVQYAPRVVTFLELHELAPAGLYLRNLGPSTLSDYKQPVLRDLLKALPWPVVLVGDSGEHDPEVYAQIRREFPARIKRIYIRDAGGDLSPERLPDMVSFADPKDAARDAVAQGLADAACVAAAFEAPR